MCIWSNFKLKTNASKEFLVGLTRMTFRLVHLNCTSQKDWLENLFSLHLALHEK